MDDNFRKAMGNIVKFVNDNIPDNMVKTSSTLDHLSSYAIISQDKKECSIFLSNQNTEEQTITLDIQNLPKSIIQFESIVFSGETPQDKSPADSYILKLTDDRNKTIIKSTLKNKFGFKNEC